MSQCPTRASRGDRTATQCALRDALTAPISPSRCVALFGGVVTGLLQALGARRDRRFPASGTSCSRTTTALSVHGVLNVLVWTTFFICGFVPFISARALGMPLASRRGSGGSRSG